MYHNSVNTIIAGMLAICCLVSCKVQKSSVAESQWELVFEDQFDGDLSRWDVWESGAYNEEIQYYTGEQVRTENGLLFIEAERRLTEGPSKLNHRVIQKFEYVSGRIESKSDMVHLLHRESRSTVLQHVSSCHEDMACGQRFGPMESLGSPKGRSIFWRLGEGSI